MNKGSYFNKLHLLKHKAAMSVHNWHFEISNSCPSSIQKSKQTSDSKNQNKQLTYKSKQTADSPNLPPRQRPPTQQQHCRKQPEAAESAQPFHVMFFNPSRLKVACCSIVSLYPYLGDTMRSNINAEDWALTFLLLALLISLIDEAMGGNGESRGGTPLLRRSLGMGPQLRPNGILASKNRIRHVRGKYKYKEEVIKKIEHDHPCKLTQTAVKITFPGMTEQVLVSFLGTSRSKIDLCVTFDRQHWKWIRLSFFLKE